MKHSGPQAVLSAFSAGFACLLTGCISVEYVAKKDLAALPDDAKVVVYYEKTQFPVPEIERIPVGSVTASASTASYKLSQIKDRVVDVARAHGANAVLVISIDHQKDGEVRSDQVKNQAAPSWTPVDDSGSDIQQERNWELFSGKDPELPLYKITIKAELYKIPSSSIIKEKVLKKDSGSARQEPDIKINIRSNLGPDASKPAEKQSGN